ncbi:uncharacterized protein LOC106157590 [Lingula anatina]|uniref:Uncharacterized protein LOC106157590 n=1 Tax=Lingula anatina TaxID=7574 RepID=A0A1S3HUL4_LINAN|nr:uncharacterized protein LOC106157590 [Lingula anatina]|eukprot:XP_013388749.1 uncharacterized protein LOC106157590 [Lingula anatina]
MGHKFLLNIVISHIAESTTVTISIAFLCKENTLTQLLEKVCIVEGSLDNTGHLTNAILAAEEQLGVSKNIISPADVLDSTVDEHALLIYVALLKRKVQLQAEGRPVDSFLVTSRKNTFKDVDGRLSAHLTPHKVAYNSPIKLLMEQQAQSQAAIQALQEQLYQFDLFRMDSIRAFGLEPSEPPPVSVSSNESGYNETDHTVSHPSQPAPGSEGSLAETQTATQCVMNGQLDVEEEDQGQSIEEGAPHLMSSLSSSLESTTLRSSLFNDDRDMTDVVVLPPDNPRIGTARTNSTSEWMSTSPNSLFNSTTERMFQHQWAATSHGHSSLDAHSNRENINKERLSKGKEFNSTPDLSGSDEVQNGYLSDDISDSVQGKMANHLRKSHSVEMVNRGVSSPDSVGRPPLGRPRSETRLSSPSLPRSTPKRSNTPTSFLMCSPGSDELLQLLENIGRESSNLKSELEKARNREGELLMEMKKAQGKDSEEMSARLAQEIEVLRSENKELYRQASSASSSNKQYQKMIEDLQQKVHNLQKKSTMLEKQEKQHPQVDAIPNGKDFMKPMSTKGQVGQGRGGMLVGKIMMVSEKGVNTDQDKMSVQSVTTGQQTELVASSQHVTTQTDLYVGQGHFGNEPVTVFPVQHAITQTDLQVGQGHLGNEFVTLSPLQHAMTQTEERTATEGSGAPVSPSDKLSQDGASGDPLDMDDLGPHGPLRSIGNVSDVKELQRSLASATLENELLQSKLTKTNTEMSAKITEINNLLQECRAELTSVKEKNKELRSNAETHDMKMEALVAQVKTLENSASSSQKDNEKLNRQLNEALATIRSQLSSPVANTAMLEKEAAFLREKLSLVEEERNNLRHELSWIRHHNSTARDTTRWPQDSTSQDNPGTMELALEPATEKQELLTELDMLKDDFEYMKRDMEQVQRSFDHPSSHSTDQRSSDHYTYPRSTNRLALAKLHTAHDRHPAVTNANTTPGNKGEVVKNLGDLNVKVTIKLDEKLRKDPVGENPQDHPRHSRREPVTSTPKHLAQTAAWVETLPVGQREHLEALTPLTPDTHEGLRKLPPEKREGSNYSTPVKKEGSLTLTPEKWNNAQSQSVVPRLNLDSGHDESRSGAPLLGTPQSSNTSSSSRVSGGTAIHMGEPLMASSPSRAVSDDRQTRDMEHGKEHPGRRTEHVGHRTEHLAHGIKFENRHKEAPEHTCSTASETRHKEDIGQRNEYVAPARTIDRRFEDGRSKGAKDHRQAALQSDIEQRLYYQTRASQAGHKEHQDTRAAPVQSRAPVVHQRSPLYSSSKPHESADRGRSSLPQSKDQSRQVGYERASETGSVPFRSPTQHGANMRDLYHNPYHHGKDGEAQRGGIYVSKTTVSSSRQENRHSPGGGLIRETVAQRMEVREFSQLEPEAVTSEEEYKELPRSKYTKGSKNPDRPGFRDQVNSKREDKSRDVDGKKQSDYQAPELEQRGRSPRSPPRWMRTRGVGSPPLRHRSDSHQRPLGRSRSLTNTRVSSPQGPGRPQGSPRTNPDTTMTVSELDSSQYSFSQHFLEEVDKKYGLGDKNKTRNPRRVSQTSAPQNSTYSFSHLDGSWHSLDDSQRQAAEAIEKKYLNSSPTAGDRHLSPFRGSGDRHLSPSGGFGDRHTSGASFDTSIDKYYQVRDTSKRSVEGQEKVNRSTDGATESTLNQSFAVRDLSMEFEQVSKRDTEPNKLSPEERRYADKLIDKYLTQATGLPPPKPYDRTYGASEGSTTGQRPLNACQEAYSSSEHLPNRQAPPNSHQREYGSSGQQQVSVTNDHWSVNIKNSSDQRRDRGLEHSGVVSAVDLGEMDSDFSGIDSGQFEPYPTLPEPVRRPRLYSNTTEEDSISTSGSTWLNIEIAKLHNDGF